MKVFLLWHGDTYEPAMAGAFSTSILAEAFATKFDLAGWWVTEEVVDDPRNDIDYKTGR